jgi:hypothetical protein
LNRIAANSGLASDGEFGLTVGWRPVLCELEFQSRHASR